jgi:hypothetical protein
MESYIQLTPLNNYLSNCVIKLHTKLQEQLATLAKDVHPPPLTYKHLLVGFKVVQIDTKKQKKQKNL